MDNSELTMEDVSNLVKMQTLDDCKQYLKLMLDFYFDTINSPEGRLASTHIEEDRNLWLQTIFSKGCQFLSLLDGVGYQKGTEYLNPIIDTSVLFSIARAIYESIVAFDALFILPKSEDEQTILYNLFMAQGLSERLKDLSEDVRKNNPQRIVEEEKDIENCRSAIESTELFANLDNQNRSIINNAFGKKFRYIFNKKNNLEFFQYENAYKLLRVREDLFSGLYSFFSLQGHPSYLFLCQFRDAYNTDVRADLFMAEHATQCVVAFMSIFIVDYMKLNPRVKAKYDSLELPRRFAIGMFEDSMRGEGKFK